MVGLLSVLWVITLVYPVVFVLFGLLFGRHYFGTVPKQDEMKDFEQQENISYVLAGFAITALSVVISFPNADIASREPLIDFFSIGFVSEIIAGFLSHYSGKRGFKYLGFAAQYTGLLGVINGFFAFFYQSSNPPPQNLVLIYGFGLAAFLLLTVPELGLYWKYWKELGNVGK